MINVFYHSGIQGKILSTNTGNSEIKEEYSWLPCETKEEFNQINQIL